MQKASIDNAVRELIAQKIGVASKEVVPCAHILRDLPADSLNLVEVFYSLEEEFGLEIPLELWGRLVTIQDIIDVASGRQPSSGQEISSINLTGA